VYYEWNEETEYTEIIPCPTALNHFANQFVKVSDDAPGIDFLVGKYFRGTIGDKEQIMQITEDVVFPVSDLVYNAMDIMFIASGDETVEEIGVTFTKGIWVVDDFKEDSPIQIDAWQILVPAMTIDEKYIPDTIARVSQIPEPSVGVSSWNELEDKPFGENVTVNSHGVVYLDKTLEFTAEGDVYTSESVGLGVNFLEGHDYCFIWDGTEYHLMAQGDGTSTLSSGLVWAGNGSIVDSELPDTGEPFYVTRADNYASMNRLIVFKTADESAAHTVKASSVNITRELKQLDEKYIPDTIARTADVQAAVAPKTEFILNSSTEGSAKQFKITIDDSGTLTVSEIAT
jgi:hypothetical protein